MTAKRFTPKDFEFTLRLLDEGCLLSHYSGVLIAFSNLNELHSALVDFRTTGKGIIGDYLKRAQRNVNKMEIKAPPLRTEVK